MNALNLAHLTMYLVFTVHATYISTMLVLKVKILLCTTAININILFQ